jgi:hypothetical protein
MLLVALPACSATEEAQQGGEPAAANRLNQLAPEERAEGWTLLFDGDDLSAWRGFQEEDVPAGWGITQNAIHYDPEAEGGGDLITKKEYGDFVLRLDWKIAEGGNSGIMYRVSEDRDATWKTGPEYQVLDNARHPNAEDGAEYTAGAVYALYGPSEDATRPAGQWNRARIVARDGRVEHWLNGTNIVSYEWGSAEWKKRVARSKFSSMPGFGKNERGHIALQSHGDNVWYRNVKIRPL